MVASTGVPTVGHLHFKWLPGLQLRGGTSAGTGTENEKGGSCLPPLPEPPSPRLSTNVIPAKAGTYDTSRVRCSFGGVARPETCMDSRLRGHDGMMYRPASDPTGLTPLGISKTCQLLKSELSW